MKGYSLMEMLLVMALLAALLMVAVPGYRDYVLKTRRILGGMELLQVMLRQEQFFVEHRRYARTLTELGLPGSPYALDARGSAASADSDDRVYLIELATSGNRYTLYARPQLVQSADALCGTLVLTSWGGKSTSGHGGVDRCW